jgi:hypothetical protein
LRSVQSQKMSATALPAEKPRSRLDDIDLSGSDTEEEIPDREPIEEAKEEPPAMAAHNPKKRKALTEEVLCDKLGLERVYREFPATCKYKGRGCEQQYLKNLIGRYKEWAFQLYDQLAYTDLLGTVETLGTRPRVKQYMTVLRERERVRYMEQVLHVQLPSYAQDASPSAAPRQQSASVVGSGYTTSSNTSELQTLSQTAQQSAARQAPDQGLEELDDAALYHLLDNYSGGAMDTSMAFSSTKTPSSAISVAAAPGTQSSSGAGADNEAGTGGSGSDHSIDRLVPERVDMSATQVDTQVETQMETQVESLTQPAATQVEPSAMDDEAELNI